MGDRILIADDSQADCVLFMREFERMGLGERVHIASSGEALLDQLQNEIDEIGIILLDINMPGLDGFGVLSKLKEDEKTRSIPVVMLTSSSRDADIQRCYDLGANAYVVKEHDRKVISDKLKSIEAFWFKAASLPPGDINRWLGPTIDTTH